MNYIIIFVSGFIIDIIWTLYIKSISREEYLEGAVYSALIGICQLSFIYSFIKNNDIISSILWISGLFLGTFFVKYFK